MTDSGIAGRITHKTFLVWNQATHDSPEYFSYLYYSRHNRISADILIGHLVLLPALSGLVDQGQTADVGAHLGTLAAVLLYLRRDLTKIATSVLRYEKNAHAVGIFGLLILASLPVIALLALVLKFVAICPAVSRNSCASQYHFCLLVILGRPATCNPYAPQK